MTEKVDRNKDVLYGGQAIIEGVMMRGPRHLAMACRKGGKPEDEIVVATELVGGLLGKFRLLRLPLLRGVFAMVDAMAMGLKALTWSANMQMEAEKEQKSRGAGPGAALMGLVLSILLATPGENTDAPGQPPDGKISPWEKILIGLQIPLAFALVILLFFVLPNWALGPLKEMRILYNVSEGVLRVIILAGYILAIGLLPDIRRVFQYHGAEHRTINAFESGEELTVENTRAYTIKHVRCGTSFLILVLVVAIIVHVFLPMDTLLERVGWRLAVLPLVAGIAYEIVRFVGRHKDSRIACVLVAPGLLFQKLTTREPSDDQVEVAIAALQRVLDEEAATAATA